MNPENNEEKQGTGPLSAPLCSASLANDVARCNGDGFQEDDGWDWREGCETCLRRTAQRHEQVLMMEPPAIIAFECEFLIPPNSGLKYKKCCLPKDSAPKQDCDCRIELDPTEIEIDACQRILADTASRAADEQPTSNPSQCSKAQPTESCADTRGASSAGRNSTTCTATSTKSTL